MNERRFEYKLILMALTYFLFGIQLYALGEKARYPRKYMAFLPVANIAMVGNISGMSGIIAIVLMSIPTVNILSSIYLMYVLYCSYENGEITFVSWLILYGISWFNAPHMILVSMIPGCLLATSESKYREKLYEGL